MDHATAPSNAGVMEIEACPNPVRSACFLIFRMNGREKVKLDIFTIKGEKVASLVNREMEEGRYRIPWAGPGQNSGMFLVKLQIGNQIYNRRILVVK